MFRQFICLICNYSYNGPDLSSNMAVIEVKIPTGWNVDLDQIHKVSKPFSLLSFNDNS